MWKSIPGYEGFYELSQDGEVRGVARSVNAFEADKRNQKSVTLKPTLRNGKPYFQLRRDGKKYNVSLNKLKRITFG